VQTTSFRTCPGEHIETHASSALEPTDLVSQGGQLRQVVLKYLELESQLAYEKSFAEMAKIQFRLH
jgi:hypothetical protein